ncbi:hypothetical protein [Kitasatospora sp. HPMI-4]|uniref:hypothetical protein n=1 Tax=Kitasatospora sp. HPMI-4 TaxID=3448443 RepID=UPI003F1A486F
MRLIFVCQECSIRYLPPVGLRYGNGTAASVVWCAECQAEMAARGVEESPALAALAMIAAVRALKDALTRRTEAAAPLPDRRPSQPPRTSRGRIRPNSGRTRLH